MSDTKKKNKVRWNECDRFDNAMREMFVAAIESREDAILDKMPFINMHVANNEVIWPINNAIEDEMRKS